MITAKEAKATVDAMNQLTLDSIEWKLKARLTSGGYSLSVVFDNRANTKQHIDSLIGQLEVLGYVIYFRTETSFDLSWG